MFPPPPLGIFLSRVACAKLRKKNFKNKSTRDFVEFVFSFSFVPFVQHFRVFTFTIMPLQIKEEILKLLELLKDMEPKVVLCFFLQELQVLMLRLSTLICLVVCLVVVILRGKYLSTNPLPGNRKFI